MREKLRHKIWKSYRNEEQKYNMVLGYRMNQQTLILTVQSLGLLISLPKHWEWGEPCCRLMEHVQTAIGVITISSIMWVPNHSFKALPGTQLLRSYCAKSEVQSPSTNFTYIILHIVWFLYIYFICHACTTLQDIIQNLYKEFLGPSAFFTRSSLVSLSFVFLGCCRVCWMSSSCCHYFVMLCPCCPCWSWAFCCLGPCALV